MATVNDDAVGCVSYALRANFCNQVQKVGLAKRREVVSFFIFCADKALRMDDNYNVRRPGETLDQLTLKPAEHTDISRPEPTLMKNPAWRWWAFWRATMINLPASSHTNNESKG